MANLHTIKAALYDNALTCSKNPKRHRSAEHLPYSNPPITPCERPHSWQGSCAFGVAAFFVPLRVR
ncbi:MAG: hypothetical protein LBU92_06550 [Prevotellaceae bacterium]|nr:hypothetical protein [Prevotellaceae bacterium]